MVRKPYPFQLLVFLLDTVRIVRQFVWQLGESSILLRFLIHDRDSKFTNRFDQSSSQVASTCADAISSAKSECYR